MRLTISEFARLVGLAPSALRFYDDCGLLPPAEVDATNGYRYYDRSQQPRAQLLRDLREIDLPLPDVRLALDAAPSEVADLVRAHLHTLEAKSTATRTAATRLLTNLLSQKTTALLGGPELSSAIRQVTPTAAPPARAGVVRAGADSDDGNGFGDSSTTVRAVGSGSGEGGDDLGLVLSCVLIELGADEVVFVATDRYRLAVRTVRPVEFSGVAARVLVRADELAEVSRWAAAGDVVRVEVNGGLTLVRGDESRELQTVDAEYPAYGQILDGLTPPACRVVVDRLGLLDVLTGRDVVAFDIDQHSLRIGDEVKLDAIGTGSVRIGFTASLLAAALEASVGPDVLLEICEPARPVVVRSADQGTFTTLVMPVRLDG
ncbi:DNA polymerase III beta subunit-like protein [Kribbella sp. VKM Ac-2571]|uniref:DNA polymerase III subunit beta family protein n=1 Tax=Kribbella sp. VKM Ac-2571 TaxID=2512222 RepID=UPI00105B5A6D|nr:MerR family transcriptional regulator [Kribbella sp. VKM Ac-2571]TDO67657.1 DNA polymerase III beta subunit-like protein [Kribbella sp. VKM Ac-2571]